jgi:hypothetical protein
MGKRGDQREEQEIVFTKNAEIEANRHRLQAIARQGVFPTVQLQSYAM